MKLPDRMVQRVSAPASEPIALSDAKTYLRVDGSSEDALISDMIKAVRMAAEEMTGRSLMTQSWRLIYSDYVPDRVRLPYAPVQSISSVKAIDEAGAQTTIAATAYHLDQASGELVCESAVCGHRVEVVYVAGYGDAATDVPAMMRQAMLVHLLQLYARRDTVLAPEVAAFAYTSYRDLRL